MSTASEWTILEKLLLTQAVYKYGENMWFQVARVLKQHGLIQPQHRPSDFFSQKNCQFQYYLLVENLEVEKQLSASNDLKNDMPPVVRIARQLYTQRVEEVKSNLQKDKEEFERLAHEIEQIKKGRWDQELKEQLPSTTTEDTPIASNAPSTVNEVAPSIKVADTNPMQESPQTVVMPEAEKKMLPEHVTNEESRMKRTASETALVVGSAMKRCRLDEKQEEGSHEDQVLSTAIAAVSKDRIQNDSLHDEKPSPRLDLSTGDTVLPAIEIGETGHVEQAIESSLPIMEIQEQLKLDATEVVEKEEGKAMADIEDAITFEEVIEQIESTEQPDTKDPMDISNTNPIKDDAMDIDNNADMTETVQLESTIVEDETNDTTSKETIMEPSLPEKPSQYNHDIPKSTITSTHGLPKISIPEPSHFISLNPQQRLEQSVSPSSKLQIMTPDEEDFTGSETATPTSTSTLDRKRANNDQRQKAWQKNINLLWQEIANHKNGTMFMNPIKKSYAPLYDKVVKQPLYLKTIKNRVRDGVVKTTAEFERDVVLMLTNSLMYNKEGTEMYLMALEMLDDVREQIRLFKSADGYSVSAWEDASNSQS